jgi:hypothetical protein
MVGGQAVDQPGNSTCNRAHGGAAPAVRGRADSGARSRAARNDQHLALPRVVMSHRLGRTLAVNHRLILPTPKKPKRQRTGHEDLRVADDAATRQAGRR